MPQNCTGSIPCTMVKAKQRGKPQRSPNSIANILDLILSSSGLATNMNCLARFQNKFRMIERLKIVRVDINVNFAEVCDPLIVLFDAYNV